MPRTHQTQLQFQAMKDFTGTRHGGDLRKGQRKTARPVAVKRPMHLVLRASKAKGEWSMLRPACSHHISAIVARYSERYHVRILRFANVGNHLHLVVRARTRKGFQNFLRTTTGLIARVVTGAIKGRSVGGFWDHLAFSRVVGWGRDLRTVLSYALGNAMEGRGIPSRRKPVAVRRAALIGFPARGHS